MRIAFVEDNEVLAKSVVEVLKHEGYGVTHFRHGDTAYASLSGAEDGYDLIVLDAMLPGMDGFSIANALRQEGCVLPILLLTSKGTSSDIVEGLDSGADDYLTKPFTFDELLARIRALLRRPAHVSETFVHITPHVRVDMRARTAQVNEKPVHLTAKEFTILAYFLRNPKRLMNQQELYDHAFDFADVQLSNTVEVHIKNLRKKLGTKTYPFPLTTVRGAGYRYDG
jgi:DNA-binding response OmpR family regulator